MGDGGFLDSEQSQVHGLLGRHVAVRAGLAEITVLPKNLEHPVLADVQTVLTQHLRQFPDQARAVACGHRVREPGFRLQFHDARLLFGDALLLRLHGALADHHGLREDGHVIIHVRGGNVTAGLANLGQHLVSHPALELLGLRLAGLHHQTIKTRLTNDGLIRIASGISLRNSEGIHLVGIKAFSEMIGIDAEDVAHVLGDEPRLPRLIGQGAQ